MPFKPGESGNPKGRAFGSKNKRVELAKLLEPYAEEFVNQLVELARDGDVKALKVVVDKLLPRRREEIIELELPPGDLHSNETLVKFGEQIIESVSAGHITTEQASRLMNLAEGQSKLVLAGDFEARLKALEEVIVNKRLNDANKEVTRNA